MNGEDAVAKVDVAQRRLVGKVGVRDGTDPDLRHARQQFLLVANQGTQKRPGTTVSVVDTGSFTVAKTVETGRGAHGVVVDPPGGRPTSPDLYGNGVAVLHLDTLTVLARVPVGDKPNGISFSPTPVDNPEPTSVPLSTAGSG